MPNQHILQRLVGIQQILNGVHQSGIGMSSASKGTERAGFIDEFLSKVLTPQFRFGDGDATDQEGNRSGQLDVVVEYPWVPSLPIVGSNKPRLYLAEGIASVIEVKSDISGQWKEVIRTAAHLSPLKRSYGSGIVSGSNPLDRIPLIAVGYVGWNQLETLQKHLLDGPIDVILVINPGLFVSSEFFGDIKATGPWSLWGFISCLHQTTSVLSSRATGVPLQYAIERTQTT